MFTTRKEAGALVVGFPPRLDTHTCTGWQETLLAQAAQENLPVVFDLSNVTFVCSLFVRICLAVYKQAGAGRFRLANLAPDIKKVFKIAGLDEMIGA